MSRITSDHMLLLADFLAENPSYEPHEVGPLQLAEFGLRRLINRERDFELSASNKDRPDAEKYGTDPDGSAGYAPEWYAVHGAATGIHEGLHGVLWAALLCPSTDGEHSCIGTIAHDGAHHDGDGSAW